MKLRQLIIAIILLISFSASAQGDPWQRHTIDSLSAGADGVRLTDVNSDGFMDIATGWEEGNNTKIYINPGLKQIKKPWKGVVIGDTPCVEDAVFCDLDGNGIYDVVSCTEGWNKKIYLHWAPQSKKDYMKSTKWQQQLLPSSNNLMQWMYAMPLDVDGDGDTDIIAGAKNKNAQLGWFENSGNPRDLESWHWYPICSVSWLMSIILRDVDGDGDMDIVFSDRRSGTMQGVRWAENPGDKSAQIKEWRCHLIGCEDLEVMFMTIADIDGDGLEDAVVTECTNRKIVIMRRLGNSGLRWDSHSIDIPMHSGTPKSVAVGDIDMDGRNDIVHSAERVNGGKEGIFWLAYEESLQESQWQWHSVSGKVGIKYDRIELIDLDHDGDLDILTCEERFGDGEKGLGIIWYENPTIN